MSKEFDNTGFLFGANSVFIEELYQKYLEDPNSVDSSWVSFFSQQQDIIPFKSTSKIIIKPQPVSRKIDGKFDTSLENSLKAKFMITAYRENGHYLAELDPLGLEVRKTHQELEPKHFGFGEAAFSTEVNVEKEFGDVKTCTIGQLQTMLEHTYAGRIAAEFMHVENSQEKAWLFDQLERATSKVFSAQEKKKFLKDLVEVEGFEQYLHTKFPGAKRFSIEGGDASIVCLDMVIEESSKSGAEEVVLGMAHRGRLSTLTKVMQKPYRAVFSEFSGSSAFPDDLDIAGDVKYHMGYSSDRAVGDKTIHLSLTPNPSHLEAVNPVVAGKVRAKQDCRNRDRKSVVGILVHGDAAFCGQGIVAESLVMSGLKPYDVGGIFHLVINNQIGFTANAEDGRPGRYCTEVAKMVGAPIVHVNGDDIESVMIATKIACDYRSKFKKDVVIDIVCYRKYGHNEGDEPMYTQAVMYNVIKSKQTPAAVYASALQSQSVIDAGYYQTLKDEFKKHLDAEFAELKNYKPRAQWLDGQWAGFERSNNNKSDTGIGKKELKSLAKTLCNIPKSFAINNKLEKLFAARLQDVEKDNPIDWATAEQLAFATLLAQNIPVRITGQDAGRGTFSHRHAVLHSQVDKSTYVPLNHISPNQAFFEIADSNLSEYGVLGFEYGYSLVNPNHLVIWEAQFGDFFNGAQIIFDQFISSAETKWLRMSGLVCLLPHGFEGQGPEHSSARLERFLQLCAEDNIQVAYPTTPASIFHLLRRQVMRKFRKPLIIMSPKSLLRHRLAVSDLSDLDNGTTFIPVIDEIDSNIKSLDVRKVIFCTGKIYYDILERRREKGIKDIAIVRLEQLYPFESEQVAKIIGKYSKAKNFVWCQEEPKNMGAWKFIRPLLDLQLKAAKIDKHIEYEGRPEAASPAVGYLYAHNKQQDSLIYKVLN